MMVASIFVRGLDRFKKVNGRQWRLFHKSRDWGKARDWNSIVVSWWIHPDGALELDFIG